MKRVCYARSESLQRRQRCPNPLVVPNQLTLLFAGKVKRAGGYNRALSLSVMKNLQRGIMNDTETFGEARHVLGQWKGMVDSEWKAALASSPHIMNICMHSACASICPPSVTPIVSGTVSGIKL